MPDTTPSGLPPRAATVGVVVLAGGTARRLGGVDKTALDVGGQPILHRLLAATTTWPTVVVADLPSSQVQARFPHAQWCREDPCGGGPAAALAAGVLALPPVDVVLAVAGDQPFAGAALPRLVDALCRDPSADAVLGRDADGRDQPLLAAYRGDALRRRCTDVLPGDSMRSAFAEMSRAFIPLSQEESLDIDAPADLDLARRSLTR